MYDALKKCTTYNVIVVYSTISYFGGVVSGLFSDLNTFEGQASAEIMFKMQDDSSIGRVVFFQKVSGENGLCVDFVGEIREVFMGPSAIRPVGFAHVHSGAMTTSEEIPATF